MERRVLALNIAAILILSALYLYESSIPPKRVNIGELGKHVGEYVEVKGIVIAISGDGKMITIEDMNFNHSAMIYSPEPLHLAPGYIVIVRGIVDRYHGVNEIIIRSGRDLRVKSEFLTVDLHILLNNPHRYDGLTVKLFAKVIYSKVIYLNVTDGNDYGHFYVDGNYKGEKKTYFYGRVKNGTLHLENPLNTEEYRDASIGEIGRMDGKRVRVYGWIVGYYLHLIIGERGYSLNVYYYGDDIPNGYVEMKGKFAYDSSRGEYSLYVGNIK